MKFSKRISDMQFSPIRKLAPYATEAKNKGIHVFHLNIGQPDIKTPECFTEGVKSYEEPVLKYSDSKGMDPLLESFIKYYKEWNINFQKDELLVTNGGSEAIQFALMALCDVGDEIIIPEPFYTNYNGFAESAGVNVVPFLTKAEEGDLFLIADEVYREFVYDGLKYTSAMYLEDVQDRVIVIDSISKRYSACGARIGLIASKNKELIHQILKLCQSRLCVPTVEQIGAANLINTPESYFTEVKAEYENRRNIMFEGLKNIPGVVCEKPTGAFYIVAKLPVDNAEEFTKWMLTEFSHNNKTVMVAPAAGFYASEGLGEDEIRLSYCLKGEDLKEAMEILKLAIEKYNSK